MPLHPARPRESDEEYLEVWPELASDLATRPLPRLRLPEQATAPRVAYQLVHDVHVLRVVVRNGFGRDLARTFMDDFARAMRELEAGGGRVTADHRAGFHH